MLRILTVPRTQRVAHVRDGELVRVLGPGLHLVWSLLGVSELLRYDVTAYLSPIPMADPLPEVVDGAVVVAVGPHERGLVTVDGAYTQLLTPGRYRLWEASRREVHLVDVRDRPLPLEECVPLPQSADLLWTEVEATADEVLVLLRGGAPTEVLPSGAYRVWVDGPWDVEAVSVAGRELGLAVQELLTLDQVTVRLRPVVRWRVVDPLAYLREPEAEALVYTAIQLALREVVVGRDLEALLVDRDALGAELLERARVVLPEVGVVLEAASIKDITLPGEVKEVLGRVLVARKEAEAEAIRRRQEVAATRQLANTAKLLADHPVLLQLKRLEALADLAGRIDRLTVVGTDDLLREVLRADVASE